MTTPEPPAADEPQVTSRWWRGALFAAIVVAAALLGASAGLVLAGDDEETTSVPASDSVDVGFSQDMTVHHRQAVLMAGIARDQSDDPAVRALAFDIETGQLEQIGRMQGWLSRWGAPALPTGGHMAWMTDPPSMSGMQHGGSDGGMGRGMMPGMASAEEIDALNRLSGVDRDVLFLQLMVRHHQGGAPMLREAIARAADAQVENLARQMLEAQTAEIGAMIEMLVQRGAQPLPPPV